MTHNISQSQPATNWTPAGVAQWRPQSITGAEIALIDGADVPPILPELDLWDNWQLAHEDGRIAVVDVA